MKTKKKRKIKKNKFLIILKTSVKFLIDWHTILKKLCVSLKRRMAESK